jgi:hypothetical protein
MISLVARCGFEDAGFPSPGKSEWGMDTLSRKMTGHISLLPDYVATLFQGITYEFNGATFYLQTWDIDDSEPWANVTLNYKGLIRGTPPSLIEKDVELAVGTLSKSFATENDGKGRIYGTQPLWKYFFETPSGEEQDTIVSTRQLYTLGANMEFSYRALINRYRYISLGEPSGPSHGLLIGSIDTNVDNVRITTAEGAVFGRERMNDFGFIISFAPKVSSFKAEQVPGTPYWECEDVVRNELVISI